MPYFLNSDGFSGNPNIILVGCGGTGGFVAEALCRLFSGRAARIVLVDHDRVERHNLLRQNFYAGDVGRFKSQVLAERLAREYNREIGYSIYPFQKRKTEYGHITFPAIGGYLSPYLLIGCVDNAAARRTMSECISRTNQGNYTPSWLVDAGNGTNWGQVLIGNRGTDRLKHRAFEGEICNGLPAPTVQRPDLLTTIPDTPPDVDCAAALDLTDQDPTINYSMASLVAQVVRRLVTGTCPWMALYLDMDQGTQTPTYATPEVVDQVIQRLPSSPEEPNDDDDDDCDEDEFTDDEELAEDDDIPAVAVAL